MHEEPFLLSTLKVYKFRPLLIADLSEVSTRPHLWVCVHVCMHVFGLLSPALMCSIGSPYWILLLSSRCLFIGGMLSRDILLAVYSNGAREDDDDTLCLVCSGPLVIPVPTYQGQGLGHYSTLYNDTNSVPTLEAFRCKCLSCILYFWH